MGRSLKKGPYIEERLENRVEEPGHLDRCWLSVAEKRELRERTLACLLD